VDDFDHSQRFPDGDPAMASACTEVVQRWFDEVWNQRRAATITELTTPESRMLNESGESWGVDQFRTQMFEPFVAAFPDVRVEVLGIISQGDEVAVRWEAIGTHCGPELGCAPTQEAARFRGISWMVVRDGKLVDGWQCSNLTEVVRRLHEKARV
jgi:predicted ester cyclase